MNVWRFLFFLHCDMILGSDDIRFHIFLNAWICCVHESMSTQRFRKKKSPSTLHCWMSCTVCSVSTGRHRHQLVRCPVWLPGCQSVRNCQPPGKSKPYKSDHSYMHILLIFTCAAAAVCVSSVSCKSFESQMNNESWTLFCNLLSIFVKMHDFSRLPFSYSPFVLFLS